MIDYKKYISDSKKADKIIEKAYKKKETLLKTFFKEIFKEHKFISTIEWRQYTPTWNDGDACTFRSGHDYADINFNEDVKVEEKVSDEVCAKIQEFLDTYSDDDMLFIFGDGFEIEASEDGINISEYYDS